MTSTTVTVTVLDEEGDIIYAGAETAARQAAARHLRQASLRGLCQAPTEGGVRYYAPGSDDYDGPSAELVWGVS